MNGKETTFTFRLDAQLKTQFAEIASEGDRSSAQLIRDFMRDFVRQHSDRKAHEAWLRGQIQPDQPLVRLVQMPSVNNERVDGG